MLLIYTRTQLNLFFIVGAINFIYYLQEIANSTNLSHHIINSCATNLLKVKSCETCVQRNEWKYRSATRLSQEKCAIRRHYASFFPPSMLSHFLFAQRVPLRLHPHSPTWNHVHKNKHLTHMERVFIKRYARAAVSHCRWARANTRHCFSWIDFIVNPSCRLYIMCERVFYRTQGSQPEHY